MRWMIQLVLLLRLFRELGLSGTFGFVFSAIRPGRFRIFCRNLKRTVQIRGCTSDRWVLNSVLVCREYQGMTNLDARTIIDAGSNIGCATIWFKHQYPLASIVALEPDMENYSLAVSNTRGLQNIQVLQAGLWGHRTRLKVSNPDAWKYALRVEECTEGSIEAESVISILDRMGWDHVDILKMDIEGAETSVLAHDVDRWIDKVNVLIIELHQDVVPECSRLLCAALARADFRLSWKGEDLVATRISPLKHQKTRESDHGHS